MSAHPAMSSVKEHHIAVTVSSTLIVVVLSKNAMTEHSVQMECSVRKDNGVPMGVTVNRGMPLRPPLPVTIVMHTARSRSVVIRD